MQYPWIGCFVWHKKNVHNLVVSSNFTILVTENVKVLISLLSFSDFELFGQNIETEAISLCEMNLIIHTGIYLPHFMYVYLHMQENIKPVRSENLTSGQIFFSEGLIFLSEGTAIVKNCSDISNTILVGYGTPHLFSSAPQMTSQLTIISSNHTFFFWAMLLCFQLYYFMPLTFFSFKQRYSKCILNAFCLKSQKIFELNLAKKLKCLYWGFVKLRYVWIFIWLLLPSKDVNL